MDRFVVKVSREEILGQVAARSRAKRGIFVCFLFGDPESRQLRQRIEVAMTDVHQEVFDGERILSGDWASTIRERLQKSRFVVADVTGPSLEILFEIGLAGNHELVLCARDETSRRALPAWLTGASIHAYAGEGTSLLIADLQTMVRRPKRPYIKPRPQPVLGSAVWLQSRDSDWAEPLYVRVQQQAQTTGIQLERLYPEDLRSFDDTKEWLSSQYVFTCLDGGPQDFSGHFFIGDVAARNVESQAKRLTRRAFIVRKDFPRGWQWVADSVQRLPREKVRVPQSDAELFEESQGAFGAYRASRRV
jgi:hypothetical protein